MRTLRKKPPSILIFFGLAWILNASSDESALAYQATHCSGQTDQLKIEYISPADLELDLSLFRSHSEIPTVWSIYERLFPFKERVDPEEMIKYYKDESYSPGALRIVDRGRTAGFAFFNLLREIPVTLLDYLAVSEEARHKGYGSFLLECIQLESREYFETLNLDFSGILIEVDKPQSKEDPSFFYSSEAYHFYLRRGAILISSTYFQPGLRPGEPRWPMYLMFLPNGQKEIGPEFKERLKKVIHHVYTE